MILSYHPPSLPNTEKHFVVEANVTAGIFSWLFKGFSRGMGPDGLVADSVLLKMTKLCRFFPVAAAAIQFRNLDSRLPWAHIKLFFYRIFIFLVKYASSTVKSCDIQDTSFLFRPICSCARYHAVGPLQKPNVLVLFSM
jgi:hypothetical protein